MGPPMNRQRFLFRTPLACLLLLTVLFSAQRSDAQDEKQETIVDSKVTRVTLFRTQAMVTRTIELDGDPGAKELVITNLPENIVPASLFAEGDQGVEVRAVRYRARAVSNSPREEVRTLEDEINSIQENLMVIGKEMQLIDQHKKYLDKLETFTPPTADFDLGRGVLDAAAIQQMTKFSFGERQNLMKAEVRIAGESQELQKKLALAQQKLREITNGSAKRERQAVLFAQKTAAGKQTIYVNYVTNDCGWSPNYTVRAATGDKTVRVEYNGLIRQMSGEDWDNVKLTLSTASPALSAAGPGLAPFRLTLKENSTVQAQQFAKAGREKSAVADRIESYMLAQEEAIRGNRVAISYQDNLKTAWQINNAVNEFDCVAITSDTPASGFSTNANQQGGEEPAVNYEIESAVSLPSRDNQQMVRVLTTDLESDFYHIATPVLTSYVYREAEINNSSKSDLLAGPLTVYLDGRFVGRSEMPTVARGQTFVVGLGADSQLRSRRELVKKSDMINGGNRETKLAYKLVIENYKETAVNIRIVDRMPIVDDDSNIRVTLADDVEDDLSKDSLYLRTLYPKGILRWDVEVAERSVSDKAHEIEYAYSLEYDRNFSVSLPGNVQEQETEYNKMEDKRRKR